jgi:hypothetical protein
VPSSMDQSRKRSMLSKDGNGCDLFVYPRIKKPVGHGFGYEPVPVDTDTGSI